jgi:hypothetical protein
MLALLHPRIRHWFIITLCFSISILAVRDSFGPDALPPVLSHGFFFAIYPAVWISIAACAALAGILEAIQPGGKEAWRFYFAAVFAYFVGHGFLGYLSDPRINYLVLLCVGLAAGLAMGFIDRMDSRRTEPDHFQEREAAAAERRRTVLAAREWQDESDRQSSGSAQAPNRS